MVVIGGLSLIGGLLLLMFVLAATVAIPLGIYQGWKKHHVSKEDMLLYKTSAGYFASQRELERNRTERAAGKTLWSKEERKRLYELDLEEAKKNGMKTHIELLMERRQRQN